MDSHVSNSGRTKENGLDKCRWRKRRGMHSTKGCEQRRGGVFGDLGDDYQMSSLTLLGKSVGKRPPVPAGRSRLSDHLLKAGREVMGCRMDAVVD
jgi:hypothetical protein